ncbi:MAG: type II toxin-antitoxin system RelE/ParE family toxin [Oscillospiraceae bacterium]|nr:type II toxin-antitoxin system RelE/ParE family toxin [Oscillospiraceae bacterium]
MKEYAVRITERARRDMEAIYDHIAKRLLAPETAQRQYDRIASEILSLRTFPARCPLLESKPERSLGMRRLLIDNYSVFYVVSEDAVTVLRVLYSASDLLNRLRSGT